MMSSRVSKPCQVCGRLLSNSFNLRRHLNCRHGIKELSDTAKLRHAAQQWLGQASGIDSETIDERQPVMDDSPMCLTNQKSVDQSMSSTPELKGQIGGGYADLDGDALSDAASSVDASSLNDMDDTLSDDGDEDSEDEDDDEGDDEEDDPLDYKDPDDWYETRDKDAAFKFILNQLCQDLNNNLDITQREVRKMFREYYENFVLFCRNLRRNKTHKKIMATVKDLMNRNENEKYSFKEALKEGIHQRKFLLDSMLPEQDTDDEDGTNDTVETTEEEEMDSNVSKQI